MKFKNIFAIVIVILLFVVASYYTNLYKELLQELMTGYEMLGILIYISMTFISTVVAPVNTLPLLPISVGLWGPVFGAIFSIIGWTLGGIVAYWIALKFGRPIVSKITDISKIDKMQLKIPEKNTFWILVGLRMLIPVDILSYVLGLFVKIRYKTYFWSTLVGVSPFAFVFAYTSELPIAYQIFVGTITLIVFIFGLRILKKYKVSNY